MPKGNSGKSDNICVDNLGHHFVIKRWSSESNASSLEHCRVATEFGIANSHGAVLNLIDVAQPGAFAPKPACGEEDLNRCSIGVKYNGSLADDLRLYTLNSSTDSKLSTRTCSLSSERTLNSQRMALLIALLDELRNRFPDAKILAKDEYDRYHIKVREDMNALRRELSDLT